MQSVQELQEACTEGAGPAGTAAGVGWRGRLHHGAGGAELVAFRTPGETCCHAARCARRQVFRGHPAEELQCRWDGVGLEFLTQGL